ncbi:conserved protein of unknown function [Pseudodesulfovibrio piezophilus C1TLV30]|uniref:Uncharacterized protein n=2 Tax=Pseudodesulfovibrio TaxID=2035811 RepID=M1WXP2_PSEP2|nr:conserved protein of unknown function [Pseudodesulfovibrio piezophilus C1TLV30]
MIMSDRKQQEKRSEINGMSYGQIMTSLLLPKNSRSNPRRILSGIAFLAFVCFFLIAALGRGCQQTPLPSQDTQPTSLNQLSIEGGQA